MGELTQSVVVCNQDGRILLYNALARQQFRALSHAPEVAGGGELIGLGRSIHGVLERSAVQHGLEIIERQRRRGVAQPVANFISARGGSLLRVRMSPVPLAGGQGAGGFILLFDDITDDIRRDRRRDRLMQTLTDEQRAALALIATAVGGLEQGVADEAERLRLLTQVREGVNGIARRIDAAASEFAETVRGRWPMEDIHIDDLMEAARTRLQGRTGVPVRLAGSGQGWLRVDSFALLQALEFLASRIVEAFGLRELQLRSSQDGGELWLDLVWSGHAASTETLMSWELDAIEVDGHDTPLTVRDVLDRNAAEMSVQRDRVGQQSFLSFALPACASLEAPCGMPAMPDSRPEFYDFDLFTWSGPAQGFDDQPLVALSYTAFDTETTGLDPSGGDEIIQIGATRIVNGKLLRGESFEQLIDPKRALGAESIAIHGIQPEMLVGQPDITTVLPAFRAFAADTVLVAHNAAFDMRFLQIKEATTGVVFDLPVLDTLLLSALLHPSQESHRLEAIAERLGVNVVGRHTALGDALVTAEVFIRMLPLLAERGIRTLGQARAASEQTYYARLKY
jgi:DNA polymerase III subunit epsilon